MFYNFNTTNAKNITKYDITPTNTVVDDVQTTFGFGSSLNIRYNDNKIDRKKLIKTFRQIARNVEVNRAVNYIIDDIVSVEDETVDPITLNYDNLDMKLSDEIKEKIDKSFSKILRKLKFKTEYYDILKDFYIDGMLLYQVQIEDSSIKSLRKLDPLKVDIINTIEKAKVNDVDIIKKENKVYQYENGNQVLEIKSEAIAYTDVGYYLDKEVNNINIKIPVSYLYNTIKYVNCLTNLEDALVVYRLVKGGTVQVHYIDTQGLNPKRADERVNNYINSHRNKMTYNSDTGEITNDKNNISMLQNYYIPRNGNSSSEITSIGGDTDFLNEMEDINYMLKKLYKSLSVPYTRLENDGNTGWFGRASEITRDELNFNKFIKRLRVRFNKLLSFLLKTELVLQNIMTKDDAVLFFEDISYDYEENNYIRQMKNMELLNEKAETIRNLADYVGKYISKEFLYKKVFDLTDDEIEEIKKQIKDEKKEDKELGINQEEQNNW